ncbi:cell wall-binding repeat-containing protein [Desulfitobacterium hafniense]|uniref:cell wall-binding repeat-containing protein n=1 Tax=Desulfitobacterium hafniense TaxID=49338 RepID=UPI00035F5D3D|nr:cell wall-binding repeat-containing protein [Desulfitobacterium hafniense]
MNKTKKALASLAIAGMVLSMAPVSVFAADEDTRLAGADRYLTSIKIAEKAYASADTAVVAAGNPNNLVDALAAAPLAAQEDAPIYLTDKADMNDDVVKSMKALGVDKVIVVGAAASKAVVDELKAAGFSVEEVKGAGRVETAEAINAKLTAPAGTFVVGYDGVADAMSVASYAAANNYAIVVTNQNGVANGTVDADYIVGGTTRVKDIAGAKRLAGADRYDTNKQVIAELDFDFGKVYVGNGLTLADALVGSVLAAQTDSPIALTDGKTVKADVASNLTDDSVIVALGGTAAVSNSVIDAVKNPPSTGEFKVESVKAAAANAIEVTFGKAPADASKVTFEVKRSSTPVTVSATWDGAVATLTGSQNFPQGDYTVTVKEGDKDLGTSSVKYEAQKVAKINVTSTKLGVTSQSGITYGYATYNVEDQYGTDITSASLANSVQFQTGVGTPTWKDGVIKIAQGNGINLFSLSTVVITGYDSNSGVSTSATLSTTTQVGTLSDFKFTKLTNADGKTLTSGDSSTVFYAEYTATDVSGNPTTNYDFVKSGLILQNDDYLTTSAGSYLTAQVVPDPKDSSKAVIEVKATTNTISMDMPVVITGMTYTGKTSSLDLTLKKPSALDSLTLMAPAYDIAVTESKAIPFTAVDQDGDPVTKYDDIVDEVTFSNATLYKNVDGTATLKNTKQNNDGPLVVTAMTKTGKYSTLTLNIQKVAKADKLTLDSSVLVSAMEVGASQSIDVGYDAGGLEVKDQYGRTMDLVGEPGDYEVTASVSANAPFTVSGSAYGRDAITINAGGAAGSGTVTFSLVDRTNPGTAIDSKSFTVSVLTNDDIKGYTIATIDKAIYTSATTTTTSATLTAADKDYAASPKVYGKTSAGAKVVLAGNVVGNVYVDSGNFIAYKKDSTYEGVRVVAKKFSDPAKTEGSATLTVVLNTPDGIETLTTPVKSTTAAPVAETIDVNVTTAPAAGQTVSGISYTNGDTITIDTSLVTIDTTTNPYITRHGLNGAEVTRAPFYFYAKDQYGKKAMSLAQISVVGNVIEKDDDGVVVNNNVANAFEIDENGKITTFNPPGTAGHTYSVKITAVTTNGLVKTIELNIK